MSRKCGFARHNPCSTVKPQVTRHGPERTVEILFCPWVLNSYITVRDC